ncbi:hypothetical protein [Streptomyces sp. WM6378]|uniref:hypothetical protein n=1 Tax=Streptomyces sp. WM6378 TaxID=1415557 RepID=UPI0006AF6AC0|nr:hypothetical protein [Streptomyces sp. WM6378]KOU43611.1 hypothetical protein ADK54_17635 [Streptomyces sp. WM6378]
MRTEITDAAIASGTAGAVLQVRLEDWFEIQIITGHTSQCSPRPASPRPSRWDLPASAPADFACPYDALQVGLVPPLAAPAEWPAPLPASPRQDPYDAAATLWFGPVPANLLHALVRAHGGENAHQYMSAEDWAGPYG